jgi:hypothetical protein
VPWLHSGERSLQELSVQRRGSATNGLGFRQTVIRLSAQRHLTLLGFGRRHKRHSLYQEQEMIFPKTKLIRTLTLGLASTVLLAGAVAAEEDGLGAIEIGVAKANVEAGDQPSATLIDRDFVAELVATGTDRLENPSGVITQFGVLSSGINTEPDQNTYLKLDNSLVCNGVDYGRNFLFQGHENGGNLAYVTRINLDRKRDDARRITLLTPVGADGLTHFNALDGSTFNPFTNTLLFTEETSANVNGAINGTGSVIQIGLNCQSTLSKLDAFFGLGSFEGIHPDDQGNIYLVEDASGTRPGGAVTAPETGRLVPLRAAAQPNSFVYRYLPNNPARLEDGGKLQALQVIIDGQPLKFGGVGPVAASADIIALPQKKLNTPGTAWPIKWVTVHESRKGDTQVFTATQAAKDAGATPFKRPENMAWLPESQLRTFFFSATGDTDAPTGQEPELAARGAWGSLFRVDLNHEASKTGGKGKPRDDGVISLFVLGDQGHNSFDNVAFANEHQLLAAEDRGDTLHHQLNALDSVWAFDVDKRQPLPSARRFIALGRDALAAPDGEEDNEPTGLFVANGSPRKEEVLGTRKSLDEARAFFTMQHGRNDVFEILRKDMIVAKK